MIDLFLFHAGGDRETAARIAYRLERGAEARVWLEETGPGSDQTVADMWEAGTAAAGILLLLSPESTPAERSRSRWRELLEHLESNQEPPVSCVLLRECLYPALLERRNFLRWGGEELKALRGLERWALGLHLGGQEARFSPARLRSADDRRQELDFLWEALVDSPGKAVLTGEQGTALAQAFAHEAQDHFREILWVCCRGHSEMAVAGELAAQAGVTLEESLEQGWELLGRAVGEHRLLVVLDGLSEQPALSFPPDARASLLVTAPEQEFELPGARVLHVDEQVESIPIEPPEDPLELGLWRAMSVCREDCVPLELAAEIAGFGLKDAVPICEKLAARGLAEPFDQTGPRLRLRLKARAPGIEQNFRKHAQAVDTLFSVWEANPRLCGICSGELDVALDWAMTNDWQIAVRLARRACAYLKAQRRGLEMQPILVRLREGAERSNDVQTLRYCWWELSWLLDRGAAGVAATSVTTDQMQFEFGQ